METNEEFLELIKEQERKRQKELRNYINSFGEQLSISVCEYCGNYFVNNGKRKYFIKNSTIFTMNLEIE